MIAFMKYWAICVLQLFVNLIVTSLILKLTDDDFFFNQDIFFSDKAASSMFHLVSLSFIDKTNCKQNFPSDWLASSRPMFELFNVNCSKHLVPLPYLTIDETLYSLLYQISFMQYNPNKPHKYALLPKSLNDVRFPFTHKTTLYAGKPTNGDGSYYIDLTENYVQFCNRKTC